MIVIVITICKVKPIKWNWDFAEEEKRKREDVLKCEEEEEWKEHDDQITICFIPLLISIHLRKETKQKAIVQYHAIQSVVIVTVTMMIMLMLMFMWLANCNKTTGSLLKYLYNHFSLLAIIISSISALEYFHSTNLLDGIISCYITVQ